MRIARRTLLAAAVVATTAPIAGAAARSIADALAGAARAARPAGSGPSATRCAQSGSPDHTMLDAAGPMAPRVLG
jgi:hypothetical protein